MSGPRIDDRPRAVHRVGRKPDPWCWVPWQFGPFEGRWDDPAQGYRVLYTARTRFGCFVEILATFRPDISWLATLDEIEGDDDDTVYPSAAPGTINPSWVSTRCAGQATLAGRHIDISAAETLPWLRPLTAKIMVRHGIGDMDGAAIRTSQRAFTQDLSHFLHGITVEGVALDGVQFESRHGDRLTMYATFEHAGDTAMSGLLTEFTSAELKLDDADLKAAMDHHGLIYGNN